MDGIYELLRCGEIDAHEAAQRVLHHPEFGGHRDDAAAVVDEWLTMLRQEDDEMHEVAE